MKAFILLLSLLFSAASIFAQSKKKINEQLNAELAVIHAKYDSVTDLVSAKADQLMIRQGDFAAAQLRNTQRQGTNLMDALSKVEKPYNQLIRLEKDPAKLVNLNDLKAEIARFQKKQLATELPKEMMEAQDPVLLADAIPVKKRSRKAQNVWLREELIRYSLAIEKNMVKLNQINDYSAAIDRIRPQLDSVYWSYEEVLYNLAVGEANLWDSIHKLREFSLKDWPKNFSPVFERAFGKPERNEIVDWGTGVRYAYSERLELEPTFIRYANPIPINEFSVEKMKEQGQVNRFKPDPSIVYSYVDEQAEFPGGRVALMQFIRDNFRIPEITEDIGLAGRIRMSFIVLEDGSIMDVKVEKGIADCPGCDREAIRIIKKMPKWKPAKLKGRIVKSHYNLPIQIHLN
jgi:hypothetical protein